MTDADPWRIGSCTTSMTALLYARLVESGRAAWGAPLADLFPDLAVDPGWGAVTIDDVLVHRGGVRPNLSVRDMRDDAADVRPVRVRRTEAAAAALAGPPDRPGRVRYSNLGWVHADARAERLLGTAVSLGQQGSNRRWAATALLSSGRRRAALAVANDGRSRALTATARLAAGALADA